MTNQQPAAQPRGDSRSHVENGAATGDTTSRLSAFYGSAKACAIPRAIDDVCACEMFDVTDTTRDPGRGLRAAHPQRLEDHLPYQREQRRVLGRLSYVLRVLLRRRLGARVVDPERVEDLLLHEREERLVRRGFTRDEGAARSLHRLVSGP